MGNPLGGQAGERDGEQGDLLGGSGGDPVPEDRRERPAPPPSPPSPPLPEEPPAPPEQGSAPLELELEGDETAARKEERSRRPPRGREEEGAPLTVGGERLARARELVRERKIHEAIALYREVVSDHPQSLKARNNLGVLYDEMGQHEMALEQFEAARTIDPDNVEVLGNLGAALLGLSRFDEAERELRRGLKLDPENVEVHAHLGILHFRRGLYLQAENELRWVCERDHDHVTAHVYRGEALNRLGRVDQALEVLERVARLQPGNAKTYYTMGILFDKKRMPQEAAQMYRKARELSR